MTKVQLIIVFSCFYCTALSAYERDFLAFFGWQLAALFSLGFYLLAADYKRKEVRNNWKKKCEDNESGNGGAGKTTP